MASRLPDPACRDAHDLACGRCAAPLVGFAHGSRRQRRRRVPTNVRSTCPSGVLRHLGTRKHVRDTSVRRWVARRHYPIHRRRCDTLQHRRFHTGSVGVRGSSPLSSTRIIDRDLDVFFIFFISRLAAYVSCIDFCRQRAVRLSPLSGVGHGPTALRDCIRTVCVRRHSG